MEFGMRLEAGVFYFSENLHFLLTNSGLHNFIEIIFWLYFRNTSILERNM